MGPKKNTKPQPTKVVEESESEHSESESSEEENLFVRESKKKPAAQIKKQVVESESESEEESGSEEEEENLFVKESKKKPAGSTKKVPAKPAASQSKKTAPSKKQIESSDESEHSSSEESEEEKQTTKVPAKPAANQSSKKKAPAKPAANQPKKKAGANKGGEEEVSEFILKQREEEARKEREKEEKKKKAEEDKIKKEAQRKIDEEQAKIRAAERSKKKAEKKEKEDIESKERSRLEKIAKLTGNSTVLTPNLSDSQSSTTSTPSTGGKVVYKNKKKKNPTVSDSMKDLSISDGSAPTTTTTTTTATEVPKETSWEDENDDWESIEDKRAQKEEEEKRLLEEEEAKKKADKEAKKNAKILKKKAAQAQSSSNTSSVQVQDKVVEYRSPIICILGHVDTGKTSLLDKIRNTNVQGGEARGITQQIGASFIPIEAIKDQTKHFAEKVKMDFKIPGLLLIDTPGHESFNNLRSRGSGLCDVAILVVDIMHGLEAQTIESINLLRMRNTPFIVALNKVDRIYDWKTCVNSNFVDAYKEQTKQAIQEFDSKVKETVAALAGQELNAELYWRNKDFKKVLSLVPTSAQTGEGISDLMLVVIQLMQKLMLDKVMYTEKLQCTLLEVKVLEGLGCTVDVVLVNGRLNEGDRIIVSGFNGPIDTTIRSILTPPPLRESRIKSQYIPHKSIKAAMGVKIVAPGLEKAVPGTSIYVVEDEDEVDALKAEAIKEVESVLNEVETSGIGISIQASTIGSLEAFSSFLKKIKVPVANVAVGPVHKKHIMQAAIMLDKDPKYAVLLAFDVKMDDEAVKAAIDMKVKVITEETIYLFEDKIKKHFEEIRQKLREETAAKCVWPCIFQVTDIFHQAKPILIGAKIKEGTLRIGTPIAVPNPKVEGGIAVIGVVEKIKLNEKDITMAKRDDHVSIELNDDNASTTLGRHFDDKTPWYSKISRESINSLKEGWGEELSQQDANVIKFLKTIFKIQ